MKEKQTTIHSFTEVAEGQDILFKVAHVKNKRLIDLNEGALK